MRFGSSSGTFSALPTALVRLESLTYILLLDSDLPFSKTEPLKNTMLECEISVRSAIYDAKRTDPRAPQHRACFPRYGFLWR
jgi:hypothetical protein